MRPEQAYVCALATVTPSPAALESARKALQHHDFSWAAACDLAARNWVLPAVAANTRIHSAMGPPAGSEAKSQFRLATIGARLRITTIERHLAPVCERWNAAGLPWALMKGAALIASVYPPETRLLNDVDVLVAPQDYTRARSALLESGFAPVTGGRDEQNWVAIKGQMMFSNQETAGASATTIDLHTLTYAPDRPYAFVTGDLLSRRRPGQFGASPVSVLDPVDVLLHMSTQLVNDRLLTTVLRLADLSLLFGQLDAADCDRRTAETGSRAALALAREAVDQVFRGGQGAANSSDPLQMRAAKIVHMLICRGWPWADAIEAVPEVDRQVAADVLELGFGGAMTRCLSMQRAIQYQRNRRQTGATVLRSVLGGVRMATRNAVSLARVGWDLRSS